MATNDIKKAVSKAGRTIGHTDNLTRALIKAGSNKQSRQSALKNIKTYKEYLDMPPETVSKLTRDELRTVVARLNKVEAKRVRNIEKLGGHGQALNALNETGGKTKASKDMTRQQLLHEYKRAKSFLMSGTSTVAGVREYLSGIEEQLGAKRPLTKDEIKRAYDLLRRYEESGAVEFYEKGSKKSDGYKQSLNVQKDIWRMIDVEKKTDDEILAELGVLSKTEAEARQDTSEDYGTLFNHHP